MLRVVKLKIQTYTKLDIFEQNHKIRYQISNLFNIQIHSFIYLLNTANNHYNKTRQQGIINYCSVKRHSKNISKGKQKPLKQLL